MDQFLERDRPLFVKNNQSPGFYQAAVEDINDPRIRWVSGASTIPLFPAVKDDMLSTFFDEVHPVGTSHKHGVQKAIEHFGEKNVVNQDLGEVLVISNGIKEVRKRASDADIQSLALIPEIINQARIFRVEPNLEAPYGGELKTAHGLARVEIQGEPLIAHAVFKESAMPAKDGLTKGWR